MKWNYRCPNCNVWGNVLWAKRTESFTCHSCDTLHVPPGPAKQHDAYVDTRDWPNKMEDAVVALRGGKCTVPGCPEDYETLDHRVAWANGGKTRVNNLYPMCIAHNQSKGDSDYNTWLKTQK